MSNGEQTGNSKRWNLGRKKLGGIIGALLIGLIASGVYYFLQKHGESVQETEKAQLDQQQKAKYVAVIMTEGSRSFSIPQEFRNGFERNDGKLRATIVYKNDLLNVTHAENIAESLVADDDCVLIVGNSNSELSDVTLQCILKSNDRPAFIMPIATADYLIGVADEENYHSILRMVPDNNNQAEVIANFVAPPHKNANNVIVLIDEENRAYSDDLSQSLIHKIRLNGGNILTSKSYGTTSRLVDYLEVFTGETQPNYIIFVGISNNGLLLIDELSNHKLHIPVIFTDGCTVEQLIKTASERLGGAVYFLSAVIVSDSSQLPTYEPIGRDAYELVERIINNCSVVTRQSVREFLKLSRNDKCKFKGHAGSYDFNVVGNNDAMSFKIYESQGGKLQKVAGE